MADAAPTPHRTGAAERHVPVLRERILGLLAPALEATGDATRDAGVPRVHVDGTLGMGGHAEAVLDAFPDVRVVGIDRDTEALRLAGERLARFGDRFTAVHARYDELPEVLDDLGLGARESVHSVLLDLGVSSLQLDETDRGFAYRVDAPLDMRMDQTGGLTAADVLNTYAPGNLVRILATYGEEKYSRPIVKAIVRAREQEPFTTSGRLVELLRSVIPESSQRQSGHPGKRTFQALRIEVNAELASLEAVLPAAVDALTVGGRLAVLTYHSLEDRMTKRVLAGGTHSSAPSDLPFELPEHAPYLRLVVRGGEEPTEQEITENSRATSARLRVAERIRSTLTDHPTRPGTTRRTKGSRP